MPTTTAKPGGAACATCPGRDAPCVRHEGAVGTARLAVVGEKPSWQDTEMGRPWSDGAGRLIGKGLRTLGLVRNNIHWTYAVPCRVSDKDLPKAAKACAPRLRAELAAANALVVVPTGPYGLRAAMSLPKKPALMKWRGSVSTIEQPWASGAMSPKGCDTASHIPEAPARTCYVLPILHPTFAQRAPKWLPILEIDVVRIGRVMADGFVAPEDQPGRETIVARTEDTLRSVLARLDREVAQDVETVGLGPTRTALVCFVLSDTKTSLVIPWSRSLDGREPWWGNATARIARMVTSALATRVMVTHNGPAFDHIVNARHGIHHAAWEDTLLMSHSTAGHMPKNLAQFVTTYIDVPPWKTFDHNGDIEAMWRYCGRDGLYTILAYHEKKGQVLR